MYTSSLSSTFTRTTLVIPRLLRQSYTCNASQQLRAFSQQAATQQQRFSKPIKLHPVLPSAVVPKHILHPPYALPAFSADPRMSIFRSEHIEIKSTEDQAKMRLSGSIASYIREFAGSYVKVGRTTEEIDQMVFNEVIRLGVYPSPLGYAKFPKSLCTSINQVACHGIPDTRKLEDGDMVNLDVSVYVDGFHGDCSGMFVAGKIDPAGQKLIDTVRKAVRESIAICGPGVYFRSIGEVCQQIAEANGYSVVKQFCGHGIGREFHIPPVVFHHRNFERNKMKPGMVFTIEPIFNEGSAEVLELDDGWTIVTVDGQRSAQHEEMILITETGVEVLTQHDSQRIAEQVKRAEQRI